MIPAHLLSSCVDRLGIEVCSGEDCAEAVKQNPETGRWFITMGHPGFNLPLNNGRGFKTMVGAQMALMRTVLSARR